MVVSLSNLKSYKQKKKKRVGRGDSSGMGTYSRRGMKGQKSRSGGRSGLKRMGLKQFLHQIPKSRGFKSFYEKMEIVNIGQLNKKFENGEIVTLQKLKNAGLVKNIKNGVKILGSGKLTKKFTIKANSFSKSAENAIKKAGGKVKLIKVD